MGNNNRERERERESERVGSVRGNAVQLPKEADTKYLTKKPEVENHEPRGKIWNNRKLNS